MVKMRTWLKGLVRPSEEAKRKKDASSTGQRENRVADEAYAACTTLLQLSCGNQASPLFRPLGGSWSIIYEGLGHRTSATSPVVAAALHAAAEFVQGAKAPDLRLQFALLVHTDEAAMSRFVRDVEGAIVCLCKDIGPSSEPLLTEEGLLNQWRSDIEAFRRRCKEIWELYMYFVFLDVKGDWALLRMVSRQLMNILEVSASSFAANLSLTGPWAQPAQQMLAQGLGRTLLQRRHQQALEEWHSAVQVATAKACESAALSSPGHKKSLDAVKAELHRQQAVQFWTHYFQTSAKVGWWDFADAFQECFCGNSCPSDVLECLRKHVAKPCKSRVALHVWESFLEKNGPSAPELIQALVKEVMADLPRCVYKAASSAPGSTDEDAEVLRLFTTKRHKVVRHADSLSSSSAPREGLNHPMAKLRQAATSREEDLLPKGCPATPNVAPPGVQQVPHALRHRELRESEIAESVTPQDPRMQLAPAEPGEILSWKDFQNQFQASCRPWYLAHNSEPQGKEPLFVQALRRVQSNLTATRKALVLRVSSGTLGAEKPRLNGGLPAIVITPNDTSCPLTTKFGRGRTEGSRTLQPHMLMTEPIASRSHFSIQFDEEKEKFQVMDTGSKWGTFKKITKVGQPVNCGDWIRIGNAELVVRFCGGGCNCHRRHAHHRLHALGVAHSICGSGFRQGRLNFEAPTRVPRMITQEADSDDDMTEKVMEILTSKVRTNGAVQKNWSSSFEQHCRDVNPSGLGSLRPGKTCGKARPSGISLEATPLEIDFISGPRIGERLLITDRLCTIGRGENCTVQLSDQSLANVSRVHCSFRCSGNRWWLCDEGSTNGTWRRLSCALEPSQPCDIESGETILAGVQEMKIEEADLDQWVIPSPASAVLTELCETER